MLLCLCLCFCALSSSPTDLTTTNMHRFFVLFIETLKIQSQQLYGNACYLFWVLMSLCSMAAIQLYIYKLWLCVWPKMFSCLLEKLFFSPSRKYYRCRIECCTVHWLWFYERHFERKWNKVNNLYIFRLCSSFRCSRPFKTNVLLSAGQLCLTFCHFV